jgi:hypothetical protein
LGARAWKKIVNAIAMYAHVNTTPESRLGKENLFFVSSRSHSIPQPNEPIMEKWVFVVK